jgi:hypothetical protein
MHQATDHHDHFHHDKYHKYLHGTDEYDDVAVYDHGAPFVRCTDDDCTRNHIAVLDHDDLAALRAASHLRTGDGGDHDAAAHEYDTEYDRGYDDGWSAGFTAGLANAQRRTIHAASYGRGPGS